MNRKTVVIMSVLLAVFSFAIYLIPCFVMDVFGNRNKIYLLGLIAIPLAHLAMIFLTFSKGKSTKKEFLENLQQTANKDESEIK